MLKRKCKITFISHGETVNTQEGRISDSEKHPPLTEGGQEEVSKICGYLKQRLIKNDKIYTSPATRCIQTVEPIAKIFKQEFTILDNLHIRKCGILNGKTLQSISNSFETDFPTIANIDVEGCEKLVDFNERVKTEVKKLVAENQNKRIIVVTYPMVIQSVVAEALKITPDNQYRVLIKTGSLTQVSFFDDWSSLIYSDYLPI